MRFRLVNGKIKSANLDKSKILEERKGGYSASHVLVDRLMI
jgi:hypothetical protein